MKKLLLSLLMPPSLAWCFEIGNVERVGVHLISAHVPDNGFNNYNPGVYVITDKKFIAGTYRNSINKQSTYFGWRTDEYYRVSASLVVITGYEIPLLLIPIPSLRVLTLDRTNIYISGGPTPFNTTVYHLNMDIPF